MDERSQEEHTEERTGLNSFTQKLYRPGPLVFLFSLAFIGLISLGYFLLTEETPPPAIIAEAPPTPPAPKVYEEETSSEMEDMVKQADLAIIETMRALQLSMNELELLDVELRDLNGRGYHYQVIKLPSVADKSVFFKSLETHLEKRIPEAVLSIDAANGLAVTINELPTHKLLIETIPLTLPKPQAKGPKLAIVIDDIGENMKVLKGLVGLNFPVTLAVWPNASNTRASVELIAQKKRDLIIHFPMEPQGYPTYNPGDDALFVSMTADEIKQRVAENVSKIPEAIGVNNHMGS
ncbi:divergent polysaccharide deacetylase family protein, partial [Pseudodesulfovibrio sp.]|nr:divergent polysaccharide deacetylase family protein [Pseudodesulfovibrio sp.]